MKRAFSLIELSIVILIIGVLIAGVVEGIGLLQYSRLSSARALTKSSPVNSIQGLILWLEPTSEASFSSAEAVNAARISSWNDISPQETKKNNATQTGASSLKPTYVEKGINNLPVLRFDGTNDYLDFDGTSLANSNYTIFVVEKNDVKGAYNLFIGCVGVDGPSDARRCLHLGQRDNNVITQDHYYDPASQLDYSPPQGLTNAPTIHSFWLSTSPSNGGKKYWNNGGVTPDKSEPTQNLPLLSNNNARIANMTTGHYKGDIAEIIMFNRALLNEDRQSVESYLSKKWGIKIS
jgi:prepilin-type N-terminal cleavage/methylation domain-containing protein